MSTPGGPPAPIDNEVAEELTRLLRRLRSGRSAPKAGRALGELGAVAVPALREATSDANPFVRSGALFGLEAAASAGADVVEPVVEVLARDADPRVQETACGVLGRLGPAAVARGRDALERASGSADERVQTAARAALAVAPRGG